MNLYYYIATNNPDNAISLCEKEGFYGIVNEEELSDTLESIAASGENGLIKVLELHPDKNVIIEVFSKNNNTAPAPTIKYVNSTGETTTSKFAKQTNTFILIGAVLISLAIISTIKP